MIGNCAKRVVTCTLVTPEGEHIVGRNWCSNPQQTCPREENDDYSKCKTVCAQWGHAEAVAAHIAGPKAMGARAFVEGHSYACRECQETLFSAGVASVSVGKPPSRFKAHAQFVIGPGGSGGRSRQEDF